MPSFLSKRLSLIRSRFGPRPAGSRVSGAAASVAPKSPESNTAPVSRDGSFVAHTPDFTLDKTDLPPLHELDAAPGPTAAWTSNNDQLAQLRQAIEILANGDDVPANIAGAAGHLLDSAKRFVDAYTKDRAQKAHQQSAKSLADAYKEHRQITEFGDDRPTIAGPAELEDTSFVPRARGQVVRLQDRAPHAINADQLAELADTSPAATLPNNHVLPAPLRSAVDSSAIPKPLKVPSSLRRELLQKDARAADASSR